MAVLTTKTGPGGTELLVRSKRLSVQEAASKKSSLPSAERSAYDMRRAVEQIRQAPVALRNSPTYRPQLELALNNRRQFWMDTCREAVQMESPSGPILALHSQHGCRFFLPTAQQVQYILDALDAALPDWDKDHPNLFFQTLEMNYPELLRICRSHLRI